MKTPTRYEPVLAGALGQLPKKHSVCAMMGTKGDGRFVLHSDYDALETERNSLLFWMTENLSVDQIHAATSFVISHR
jgi:hypothetical protein